MINLIEKFIEETEQMRVLLSHDKRSNDYQEVYFFLGKDSVLCISKQDNKVLYQIKYSQLQINIASASEFMFNVGGQSLFFCQDDEIVKSAFHETLYNDNLMESEDISAKKKEAEQVVTRTASNITAVNNSVPEEKYKYKSICERCNSRKCSQYDTINGRNFKFGKGSVSEDMMKQYEKYCETKIKKFGCAIE